MYHFRPGHFRPSHAFRHTMGRRGLCLLLCVSVWRGPLPWVHEHQAHQNHRLSDQAMADHLAIYHRGDVHDLDAGWHLHMFFPEGPASPDENDSRPVGQRPLLLGASAGVSGGWLAAIDGRPATWLKGLSWHHCPAGVMRVPSEAGCLSQLADHCFIGTLLAALPVRAVTGVALC